jgi:hypothetical protein
MAAAFDDGTNFNNGSDAVVTASVLTKSLRFIDSPPMLSANAAIYGIVDALKPAECYRITLSEQSGSFIKSL